MPGSVTFDAMGGVQELRLSMKAGRRLEKALGQPFNKLLLDLDNNMGFELVGAFFAACLNGGRGVPDSRADEIIDEIGGLAPASELLGRTVAASMPDPDEAPEAAAGNGKKAKG